MIAVYFFAGILAVLLAVVLVAPLFDSRPSPGASTDPRDRLADALDALRELEFEHETGKVSDEDYRTLRARYAAEAIAARDAGAGSESSPRPTDRDVCPVCEASVDPAAKFCSRCGSALEESGARAGGAES